MKDVNGSESGKENRSFSNAPHRNYDRRKDKHSSNFSEDLPYADDRQPRRYDGRDHSIERRRDGRRYHDDRRSYYEDGHSHAPHEDYRRHHDRQHATDRHHHSDVDRHHRGRSRSRDRKDFPKHSAVHHEYHVVRNQRDDRIGLDAANRDPRNPDCRMTKQTNGRNTESFDPASTLVRPDLRIHVSSGSSDRLTVVPLKHDDVVIVPELFGKADDWTLYYQLVKEMTELQKNATQDDKGVEWISWHEGAHLICKNPTGSPTFQKVIDRLCDYFSIRKTSIGTRFNWYKDSADWKPFHHDSAAFNPQRAKNQNITVGVSFGATRELAFIRAAPLQDGNKVKLYFPQTNNGVFSFGRDANILWKHGVNALPPEEQDGKGRISIVLWGLAEKVVEEKGSPPLLGADGKGPHGPRKNHHHNHRRGGR